MWLRLTEYAAFWGLSTDTVRVWVKRKLVTVQRKGSTLFIWEDSPPAVVVEVIRARHRIEECDEEVDD